MIKKNQVVRFMIGNESFGIDIGRIREIVTVPAITKVPNTPDFLEGMKRHRTVRIFWNI